MNNTLSPKIIIQSIIAEIKKLISQTKHEDEHVLVGLKDMLKLTLSFSGVFKKVFTQFLDSPELGVKLCLDTLSPKPYHAPSDNKCFKNKAWQAPPFSYFKEHYEKLQASLTTQLAQLPELTAFDKGQARLWMTIFFEFIAPYHHVITSPELLSLTAEKKGVNLLQGFENFLTDLSRWHGYFVVTRAPIGKYVPGENIATTPGIIIYQNQLIELISYTPAASTTKGKPLLLVTSWINKYYILDIKKRYSFIHWLTQQGFHVYTISWNMPDASFRTYDFEHYLKHGVLSAIDEIVKHYPTPQLQVVGYCLGGTLLATVVAYLAQINPGLIQSLTLLASMIDFSAGGDMKFLLGDAQIQAFEQSMQQSGLWNGRKMASAFNLIDGIHYYWPFYRRAYLQGEPPVSQELVAWLQDYTHTPEALFNFYMKILYRDNQLVKSFVLNDTVIDFSKVTCPVFCLGLQDDHLTPKQAAYDNIVLFPHAHFILGDEGHVIGTLSTPNQKRLGFYKDGDRSESLVTAWEKTATYCEGSWWLHWLDWMNAQKGTLQDYPFTQFSGYPEAPGEYVHKTML